eukprot:g28034.t1
MLLHVRNLRLCFPGARAWPGPRPRRYHGDKVATVGSEPDTNSDLFQVGRACSPGLTRKRQPEGGKSLWVALSGTGGGDLGNGLF